VTRTAPITAALVTAAPITRAPITATPAGARPISEVLEQARSRLVRLEPADARAAMRAGALLVDIRPQAQRSAEGEVPGALPIERNVLEWRLDPASDARLPEAGSYDLRVIVMCSAGYTSSLAAVSLQDLGLFAATDLAGGFQAWARAGLPVQAA
jgi:rhodanese-related sulfurtransferase